MPLDPIAKGMLVQLIAAGLPPFESMSPVEARTWMRSMMPPTLEPEQVAHVEDRKAGEIPARVYRPESATPLPMPVYFHGGGWVIGDLARSWCAPVAAAEPPGGS